jgi:type VII secretion integral membrane protein EccD
MAAAGASAVALSRVEVWYQGKQRDLSLPSRAPISDYIDGVVDEMSEIIDIDTDPAGQWTLARPGGPLRPDSSLADARIPDGGALELRVVASTERYRPVIEDVIDAVAAAAAEIAKPLTTESVRRAGLAALVVGGLALCGGQWTLWVTNGYRLAWMGAGVAGAVVALVGTWSAARRYRARDAATAWAAVWLVSVTSLAEVVPVSQRTGSPGLAHLLVAAVSVCAAAVCALWITGEHPAAFSAVAASSAVLAIVSAVLQYTDLAPSALAAVVLALSLVGVYLVPGTALSLARISLPPVPAVTDKDPVTVDVGDTELAVLWIRARRAVHLSAGLTVAAIGVVSAAAVWVFDPHSYYRWQQIGIVWCTAIFLVLRGRTLPDRIQSYAMFTGAAVIIIAAAAKLLAAWPTGWRPIVVLAVVAAITVAAVLAAVVVAPRRVPEDLKARVERLEQVAVVIAIPLCVWVTGVFAAIRNVSFG